MLAVSAGSLLLACKWSYHVPLVFSQESLKFLFKFYLLTIFALPAIYFYLHVNYPVNICDSVIFDLSLNRRVMYLLYNFHFFYSLVINTVSYLLVHLHVCLNNPVTFFMDNFYSLVYCPATYFNSILPHICFIILLHPTTYLPYHFNSILLYICLILTFPWSRGVKLPPRPIFWLPFPNRIELTKMLWWLFLDMVGLQSGTIMASILSSRNPRWRPKVQVIFWKSLKNL